MPAQLASDHRRHGAVSLARRVLAPAPPCLTPAVVAGFASVASGIGLLATSGWLITRASLRPPVFVLSIAIGLVQAFSLSRGVARYFQRLHVHDIALALLAKLRVDLYETIEPLVPGGLSQPASGAVLAGLVSDAELVAEGMARSATAALDVTVSIVLGTLLALLIEPGVALVIAVAGLAVAGAAVASTRLARAAWAGEASDRALLAGDIVETVGIARELVAYGRDDLITAKLGALRRRSVAAALRQGAATGVGRAAAAWLAGGALVAVLAAGIAAHDAHRLSGVTLAVLSFVALAVLDTCAGLPTALADSAAADAAAERLADLSRLAASAPEPAGDEGWRATQPSSATLERATVERDGARILHDLSLCVSPGRRLAIVGPNGSGKTTALHLLLHFLECSSGRATLAGTDVKELTRGQIAAQAAYLPDDAHVFATSLRDNLVLGRPSASEEDCLAVLQRVGLGTWYESLPAGLATQLGAGGRPLSAGERHRLGLARAILAETPMLFLDEPTAHIDGASSERLLADLLEASGQQSVVVVSHEPGLAAHVDETIEMAVPGDQQVAAIARAVTEPRAVHGYI